MRCVDGIVVTRDEALHRGSFLPHGVGYGVSGNDAELVLRGLGSMALRYAAQEPQLARWPHGYSSSRRSRPYCPALEGSPGHEFWQRDCTAAACLLSIVFKPGYAQAQVDSSATACSCPARYSWAGPMSLCAPYERAGHPDHALPFKGGLVRFSIGLEAVATCRLTWRTHWP